ncbi:N-glycosylase/DNA lyase [anaerobic digester metagenome]
MESKPVSPKPVQPPQALTEFARLLGEIPIDAWNRIVENEPEWQEMQRFLPKYGFGPFAVLMTVCGLNDYQLKGKAEHAYWPPIRELLEAAPAPKSPVGLGATLAEFYEHERLATDKLRRLAQFIRSPLAGELWRLSPEEVSRRLVSIWQDLADVMRQSPEKKTIVFAMKCLAIALLMAGETTFPFERIQIPVDIRINEMTARLGGPTGSDDAVRTCWDGVLAGIRRRNPAVTMVHLDSLVWQLAGESGPGRRRYFDSLGVPAAIADRCVDILEGKPVVNLEKKPVETLEGMPGVKLEGKPMVARTAGSRRALILIPCSNLKTQPRSPTPGAEPLADLSAARDVLLADLVAKPEFLEFTANRKGIGDPSSPAIPAIDLYSGKLYSAAAKSLRAVAAGKHPDVEVLIVSALYGLVRLTEPIKWYDLTMGDNVGDGRHVYQYWTDTGLWKQLEAFIAEEGITNVWSLLPDSLPHTPYHRVFQFFWAHSGQGMPECIHVMALGVSMATGVRRGRWLNQVLSRMPEHLTAEAPQAREVGNLLEFPIAYRQC